MFLESIKRRNLGLVQKAVELHQGGLIPPNTIVLDADSIERNVEILRAAADRFGLKLYFMLKQIRNPQVFAFVLTRRDRKETVCVDTQDAKAIWESGHGIGHVGHLVQIPKGEIRDVLLMRPEVVTVFSLEKARQVSAVACELKMSQDLLLRVRGEKDIQFPSMEGGIPEHELERTAREISRLEHVRIVGVTSFPALSYSNLDHPELTPNFYTLLRSAKRLKAMGLPIAQINAPGNTSSLSIEVYGREGATHIEPGHGITGTTPLSLRHELPETPAMVYVSEVLHIYDHRYAYVAGGGFYWEDRMILGDKFRNSVLVGHDADSVLDGAAVFAGCAPHDQKILIDYHGVLEFGTKRAIDVGDTAVFGFRTQAFATRCAHTAVVRGIHIGEPTLLGVYDHCGHRLRRWP